MTGSFLDTTIVIHVADNTHPFKNKGVAFINANQPSTLPYYALRELLAGHVQILCDAHNIVQSTDDPAEAILAILNRSPAEGRKRESKNKAIASALHFVLKKNPNSPNKDLKREVLQSIALRVNSLWRRARKLNGVALVQSLACFNDGSITYGAAGELRGPSDSFNCFKLSRCAAAAYLYDKEDDIQKMINALHSSSLDPKIIRKSETSQRRKALKELLSKGPIDFNKIRCRALGDAYFAAMCPAGSVIATSNKVDYEPLCLALNKKVIVP